MHILTYDPFIVHGAECGWVIKGSWYGFLWSKGQPPHSTHFLSQLTVIISVSWLLWVLLTTLSIISNTKLHTYNKPFFFFVFRLISGHLESQQSNWLRGNPPMLACTQWEHFSSFPKMIPQLLRGNSRGRSKSSLPAASTKILIMWVGGAYTMSYKRYYGGGARLSLKMESCLHVQALLKNRRDGNAKGL